VIVALHICFLFNNQPKQLMRKTLLVTVSFFFISAIQAQTTFGLKLGANIANLKATVGSIGVTLDSKLGFHGGGFFTIPAAKNFSIQPEIVYSLEGAEFDQTNSKISLHMINVPLMFQYNSSGFIVEAGPQLGFLLSAKEDGQDATEGYESVNVGLGFGAAYRLNQGIGFSARYNLGLTGVAKDEDQDVTVKSNVIQLGITFNVANLARRR